MTTRPHARARSGPTATGTRGLRAWLLPLVLLAFTAMVVRNAWLSDDAYITFRTVDNVVNGHGLTWNVAERVQVYTHPLWMFLLTGAYALTGEIFYTSLALSIGLSVLAAALVATKLARSPALAGLAVGVLTLSKAFVDYATSGLENPLSHVLFALFLIRYLRGRWHARSLFWMTLLAALAVVNRQDALLLYVPALLYALVRVGTWRAVGAVALGALPVVLWEAFSLLYYGFPFPNTAYAKLNAGLVRRGELVREGLIYLHNSLLADPLTLLATALGVTVPLVTREGRKLPVAVGLVLYLLYVVSVGGGFMSGRFLTLPLFGGVALLAHSRVARHRWAPVVLCVGLLAVGLGGPYSPIVASGARGGPGSVGPHWVRGRSITDERANYYRNTGLLPALGHPGPFPNHDWAKAGRAAREAGPAVVRKGSVGFFGYFAGPEVHVIDVLGLGDALLARLPLSDPHWSIGHFGRVVPQGYPETLRTGENHIADPHLARYYDALALVLRGDLLDGARLRAIWRLNTGAYQADLDAYAYARGATFLRRFRVVNPTEHAYVAAYLWNAGAGEVYLLDEASTSGRAYTFTWRVTPGAVTFDGAFVRQLGDLAAPAAEGTLNVGVVFSPDADLAVQDKYEYRYWYRLNAEGEALTVVLPGQGFYSAATSQGYWVPIDIHAVLAPVEALDR